jgi:hypothetical protein
MAREPLTDRLVKLRGVRRGAERFRPMKRGPPNPDHAFVMHHSIGRRISSLALLRFFDFAGPNCRAPSDCAHSMLAMPAHRRAQRVEDPSLFHSFGRPFPLPQTGSSSTPHDGAKERTSIAALPLNMTTKKEEPVIPSRLSKAAERRRLIKLSRDRTSRA